MARDGFGTGKTEAQSLDAAHPALRKFAQVLRTLEDCSKEVEGIEDILIGENLAHAKNPWREELHLVAVHAREGLTQLTQELQDNLSLLPLGGMSPPGSEGAAEADGKAVLSRIVGNDANLAESSRRGSQSKRWCPHACGAHQEMMDPTLWRKLPHHVLELIFARLPLRYVFQLQSLSKYWRDEVEMSKSFHKYCSEYSAQRFALVTFNQRRDCKIHLCDVEEQKWLLKTMDAVKYGFWASPVIAAGGLLCIIDLHQLSYGALSITMCNPLTNKTRVLPPLTKFNRWFPKMMQLLVDDSRRHYKLIVVGSSHRTSDTLMMEVYDSQTESWESFDVNPAPGKSYWDSSTSVCGYEFSHDGQCEGIVKYDTKQRVLNRLVFPSHPNMVQRPTRHEVGMNDGDVFAVVGTQRNMEVLYKLGTDPLTGNSEWVPQDGGSSSFASVNNLVSFPRSYYKRVFVAGSLVLVAADNRERADLSHHQILMLKDFSSDDTQWIQLPKLGKGEKWDMWELNHAIMMELRWDAAP